MTVSPAAHHEVRATAGDAGQRIDKVLARAIPALTRARIKALILDGRLRGSGGTITDPDTRVKPGQVFRLEESPASPMHAAPEAMPLVVVYEDDELIVVDKPAGLVVHPAPGNPRGTLVNALLAHCGGTLAGVGGVRRPGIVHRLDKDTSGLIVAAKTDRAHQALVRQFSTRTVERAYTAIVWGVPRPVEGEITGAIGRSPHDRKKMAVLERGGRPAATGYRVLRAFAGVAAAVECRLRTGRTHQVRVHMASLGHPLVGDRTYGRARGRRVTKLPDSLARVLGAMKRQALHARVLGFSHPVDGRSLRFESPLPPDMAGLLETLAHTSDYK